MGVASHLGIELNEYDSRIRTFIPHYEEMLDVAAAAVPARARTIVDLGIGTGALSARCLRTAPPARTIGIDVDPDILALARSPAWRPRRRFTTGSFLRAPLPHCDAVVASFALHHVRTRARKSGPLPAHPRRAPARRRVRERRLPAGDAMRRCAAPSSTRGWRTCDRSYTRRARQRAIFDGLVARGRLRAARRRARAAALGRIPRRAALAPGRVRRHQGGALVSD